MLQSWHAGERLAAKKRSQWEGAPRICHFRAATRQLCADKQHAAACTVTTISVSMSACNFKS